MLRADFTLMRWRCAPASQGGECCRPGSASQSWRVPARCRSCARFGRPARTLELRTRVRCGLYFLAIGFAFLFIEIASIQRFVLFLGHPVYAISVVLCGFLFFAGIGSGMAPKLAAWVAPGHASATTRGWRSRLQPRLGALDLAVAGIVVVALLYLLILPPL